jgi:hypothetical protein
MLTYQRSKIWSPQSCSQSADPDEGSLLPLLSADHEQLWLTYKLMKSTEHFVVSSRFIRTSILKVLGGLSLFR